MSGNNPDVGGSLEIAQDYLAAIREVVEAACTLKWRGEDGNWKIIIRAALRRQYDGIEAIVGLVKEKRAHLGAPLLRPACEELLWIAYLRKVGKEDREAIVSNRSMIEVAESLNAQRSQVGKDKMQQLGFPDRYVDAHEKESERAERNLREIGTRLGWKLTKNRPVPSVRFIAEKTGKMSLYDLIYYATSRTVHFSVSEMMRRAWGTRDEVTISSRHMDGYWADFSIYWSLHIFAHTFHEVVEEIEQNEQIELIRTTMEVKKVTELMTRLAELGRVPIITPEELNLHLDPNKPFEFD